ncbi:bifunctional 3'-5' exonuclease/DNA polymerase [Pseudolysinimonas kribbensis]|uniref:bifunctional 3'-5' exonuclease/DNA polymerase n=1 Tax=Pseudolysinimonas kribbensis TaxID=433641 RepID=UPI0031DB45B2
MFVALSSDRRGTVTAVELDGDAVETARTTVPEPALAAWVAEREVGRPRWVWSDTARWYPDLLAGGVRIERCVDLRLCRRILRNAVWTAASTWPDDAWNAPADGPAGAAAADALFALEEPRPDDDPVAELRRQRTAVAASSEPGRLGLLVAAESVGSLVAAEMSFAGLPWRADLHDAILRELLGDPGPSGRPARMEALLAEVRAALDAPELNPDSPVELVKGLQRAGLRATSTRSWELKRLDHPAIPPLLEYKKLARLLSANGWSWLAEWVRDGRFRPVYVPGGVVTGRWAADGGGALQLPKQVRGAAVADPGWRLVVGDAAQLEPRVLAAMSRDVAMARAGQAQDMYQGMVDAGAVETRPQAKYGMLGAIYGGTTGESGRMRPRIERAFPRAMAFVEDAARAGERGEVVTTWLGRSSPPGRHGPGRIDGADETLSDAETRRAQNDARGWGRFTRNFVVQGTAAEWALCWMGGLRRRLWELGGPGQPLTERPHLVFFLHDELIVHTPAALAPVVEVALRESAAEAGRLLFGAAPVEFALTVATVERYADAK